MNLSMPHSDQGRIDRLIDIARGVASVGPADRENREVTRLPFCCPAALVLFTPSGETTPPTILAAENISSGGLCVISRQELSVGSRGAVMITKSDGEAVILGARVMYANTLGPKGFVCGIEFEMHPRAITRESFQDVAGRLPQLGPARAA